VSTDRYKEPKTQGLCPTKHNFHLLGWLGRLESPGIRIWGSPPKQQSNELSNKVLNEVSIEV
jgi:hypothetical protein